MRKVLCILTSKGDDLSNAVVSAEKGLSDCAVATFDLAVPKPDYEELLEAIASADSVQVL
jgi:hypothetical protein